MHSLRPTAWRGLLLRCLCPFLLPHPLQHVRAVDWISHRRVESATVAEDELDIPRELLHGEVLPLSQLLAHSAEVHGMFDLLVISEESLSESKGSGQIG